MFCPHCGKEVQEGMQFCPHCGKSTQRASGPKATVIVAAVLGVALLIALVVIIALLAGQKAPGGAESLAPEEPSALASQSASPSAQVSPSENLPEESEEPAGDEPAQITIPRVTQSVDYTDFVGEYVGDDPDVDIMWIEWEDFMLDINAGGYRMTYFMGTIPAETELEGNSFSFWGKGDGNTGDWVTLSYVPASESPYGVDTVYAQWWEDTVMAFKRTPDSGRFDPYVPSDPT